MNNQLTLVPEKNYNRTEAGNLTPDRHIFPHGEYFTDVRSVQVSLLTKIKLEE